MSEYFVGSTGANNQTNFSSLDTSEVLDDLGLNTGDAPTFSGLFLDGSGSTIFSVDGSNGRLFGVTDEVTGTVFSVNDAAGLPIVEVESTSDFDKITLGEYGSDLLVLSGQTTAEVTGSQIATQSWVNSLGFSADTNYYLTGVSKSGNTFTFEVNGASDPTYTLTSGDITGALGYTPVTLEDDGSIEAEEFIGDLRGAVSFKAQAGEAIAKGEAVFISGISGNTTVVGLADANDATRMPAFGIASEAASANNPVTVINFGSLGSLDTDTPNWDEGDELFVSNTAGALTTTAPTSESSLLQKIAKVTRRHASAGSITVMGAGRTNAVPNLNEGRLFVGNSSNEAVADGTIHVDIANSRVGIGTNNPSHRLDVESADDTVASFNSTDNKCAIALNDDDTTVYLSAENGRGAFGFQAGTHANNLNIDVNGNVGIGTTSPSAKLDVRYDSSKDGIFVKDEGGGAVMLFGADGSNNARARFYNGSHSQNIEINSNAGSPTYFNAGNVGIGTASPAAKLDVNSSSGFGILVERGIEDGSRDGYGHSFTAGNAHILGRSVILESSLWFSNPSPDATTSTYNIATNSSNKLVVARVVGGATQDNNIFVVDGSNVGIGTASPSQKLDVQGTMLVNNEIQLVDSNMRIFRSSNDLRLRTGGGDRVTINSSGKVGIGTTSPAEKLHVDGEVRVDANEGIAVRKIRSNYFSSGQNLDLVCGASASLILGDGTARLTLASDDTATFAGDVVVSGGLTINGTTTTINSTTLQVDDKNIELGTVATPTDTTADGGGITLKGTTDKTINWVNSTGAWTFSEKVSVPADESVFGGSGNVPIYVRSTGTVSYIQIQNSSTGSSGSNDGLTVGCNGNAGYLWLREAANLNIGTNDTTAITISSNQNTTFAGDVYITEHIRHDQDSDTFIRFQTNDVNLTAAGQNLLRVDGNSTQKTVVVNEVGIDADFRVESSGEANALFVRGSDGNVGIGTTSPQEKLDISGGNIRLDDGQRISWSTADANIGRVRIVGNESSDFLAFTTDNSERLRINSSGNVGIGITSPQAKLQVSTADQNTFALAIGNDSYTGGSPRHELLMLNNGSLTWYLPDNGSTPSKFQFYSRDTSSYPFTIDSDTANVGIGTTSPTDILTINQTADNNAIRINGYDDESSSYLKMFVDNNGRSRITQNTDGASGYLFLEAENYLNLTAGTFVYTDDEFRIYDSGQLSLGNGADFFLKYDNSTDKLNIHSSTNDGITMDTSGNVGIGTTSPEVKLHIGTSTLGTSPDTNADIISSGGITIEDNRRLSFDTDYYVHGNIRYNSANPATEARLEIQGHYGINFITRSSSKMVISGNTGNVGIGTTSPSAPLDISSSATGGTTIELDNTSTGGRNWTLYSSGAGNSFGAGKFALYDADAASVRMLVDTSGNVGIGTTSPASLLHISSSTSGDAVLTIEADTDNNDENDNPYIHFKQDGGGVTAKVGIEGTNGLTFTNSLGNHAYLGSEQNHGVQLYANGAAGLTLRGGGDIGIGTNAPATRLDVYKATSTTASSTGTPLLRLHNYVGSDLSQQKTFIDFTLTDDNGNETPQVRIGAEVGQNGDANSQAKEGCGAFVVYTNNADTDSGDAGASLAERMRVDYQGNVGIGRTDPSSKLHVAGEIRIDDDVKIAGDILRFTNDAASAYIQSADALILEADYDADDTGGKPITFKTAGTTKMTIAGGGDVTINNDLTVSGDLTVNGTTSTINSTTLQVDDKNIELGTVATPTDATADGGGITLKGATDKTINWVNSTDAWTFSNKVSTSEITTASGTLTLNPAGSYVFLPSGKKLYGSNIGFGYQSNAVSAIKFLLGASIDNPDMRIERSSNDLLIQNEVDDGDIIFKSDDGSGGVTEYFRLDGSSTGLTVSAPQGMVFFDSIKAKFGNNDDLQIYHTGTDSIIRDTGTGGIKIDSNYVQIRSANGTESQAKFIENGAVELYYDNSKKFETTSTGTITTGNVLATNNIYAGGTNGFVFGSSTSEGEYIHRSGNDIKVHAGGSDRLTVDGDNGNVGVGATSPVSKLHVYQNDAATSTTAGITIEQDGTGDSQLQFLLSSAYRWVQGIDNSDGDKFKIGRGNAWSIGEDVTITTSGEVGIGTTTPSAKLEVNGHFAATTKSFIVDNPKTGGKLQYGVVESDQHSVFVRGKNDTNTIELPEEWEWLVDEDSVTVDLTSIGQMQQLFVISQDNKTIKIGGLAHKGKYNYTVYGERKDVAKLKVNI